LTFDITLTLNICNILLQKTTWLFYPSILNYIYYNLFT